MTFTALDTIDKVSDRIEREWGYLLSYFEDQYQSNFHDQLRHLDTLFSLGDILCVMTGISLSPAHDRYQLLKTKIQRAIDTEDYGPQE